MSVLLAAVAVTPLAGLHAAEETPSYDHGAEVFNVKAFGAKGDGVTDDTLAIIRADAAALNNASLRGGTVYFPGGTYRFTSSIIAHATWMGAGVGATTLKLTQSLGERVPAINLATPNGPTGGVTVQNIAESAYRNVSIRDLTLIGPAAPQLGVPTAHADGIKINAQQRLDRVRVEHFDAGIVLGETGGHRTLSDVTSTNNYYGLYADVDHGDNYVVDSSFEGNSFASVAKAARTVHIGFRMERTRLGKSPYGFYEEALVDSVEGGDRQDYYWLAYVQLHDTTFRQIGNGAFYSENLALPNGGRVTRLLIDRPQFSWDSAYRIPTRPRDYALMFGLLDQQTEINEATSPFTDGDKGTLYVHNMRGSIEWLRNPADPAPTIHVNVGAASNINVKSSRLDQRRGHARIPAGQSSTTITLGYLAPADTIFPIVQATGDGGVPGGLTLLVSAVTASPTAGTRITVSVADGVPTSDLTFVWRVM